MNKHWREASTLILTALKNPFIKGSWNYTVLTLQRSTKSSFMPNGYVFPGGATDLIDSHEKWLNFLSDFDIDVNNFSNSIKTVPPLIENQTGQISKLLSLKLTAIRETFEETGILLCFNKNERCFNSKGWMSFNTYPELEVWRTKVQKDPSEFLNLCIHYHCCPDVNNLHLWSNWLTPTNVSKRFDTAFFIASLKEPPDALADKMEVQKLFWSTPEELMKCYKTKKIWLPPPQVYETARLLTYKDINELSCFIEKRSKEGCERWMPLQIKTLDGVVSLLPGDNAYIQTDFNALTKPDQVKMTIKEFRSLSKVLHRMEFSKENDTKIIIKNYNPTNGHNHPVCDLS